jgi:hypothetical protein
MYKNIFFYYYQFNENINSESYRYFNLNKKDNKKKKKEGGREKTFYFITAAAVTDFCLKFFFFGQIQTHTIGSVTFNTSSIHFALMNTEMVPIIFSVN